VHCAEWVNEIHSLGLFCDGNGDGVTDNTRHFVLTKKPLECSHWGPCYSPGSLKTIIFFNRLPQMFERLGGCPYLQKNEANFDRMLNHQETVSSTPFQIFSHNNDSLVCPIKLWNLYPFLSVEHVSGDGFGSTEKANYHNHSSNRLSSTEERLLQVWVSTYKMMNMIVFVRLSDHKKITRNRTQWFLCVWRRITTTNYY
jgi:hypothetical protein